VLGVGRDQAVERLRRLADVLQLLGQGIAEQQPRAWFTSGSADLGQTLDMVVGASLLAQGGEQMVRARIARRQRQQRFQRGFGFLDLAKEVQRHRLVVSILGVLGAEPDCRDEMAERRCMIAQARVNAAHRVTAERIIG
jgi:hypothetical protein